MFATSDGDPVNIIDGFKNISIIGGSMTSRWLVGTFCTSFLSYQLETWQMLADNNSSNNNSNMQMESRSNRYHKQNNDDRQEEEEEEEKFDIAYSNFPIAHGARGRERGRLKDRYKLITMQTGSIDDSQQVSLVSGCSIRPGSQIWRTPEYTTATAAAAAAAALAKNGGRNPTRTLSASSVRFEGRLGDPNMAGMELAQPINNDRYFGQGISGYRHNQPQPARLRGAQGQGNNCATTNFWSQTSMDERGSEYLALRNFQGPDFSPSSSLSNYHGASNVYQSCHRTRNASYSSARIPNNTSNLNPEFVQYLQHPSAALTGVLNITNSRLKLLGHCSPSSSGSLPASLQQHCNNNRHSCTSGSLDTSSEEPVSLPLMNAADNSSSRKIQQEFSAHRHQPTSANQRTDPASQIYSNQQPDRSSTGYRRWRHEFMDANVKQGVDKTLLARHPIFKHSIDNHTFVAGSDSELYSHKHQIIDGRNEICINYTTNRSHGLAVGQSAVVSDQQQQQQPGRRALRHRNTSDILRAGKPIADRLAQTSPSNVQKVNTVTRVRPMDGATRGRNSSEGKLSISGTIRRLGFKQKGLLSLSVQRSEEVAPLTEYGQLRSHMMGASSFVNSRLDSSGSGSFWISEQQSKSRDSMDPRTSFVEGLGPGQIASRQALVSPYLGDIQLTLNDRRGMLEVEVVRARRLQLKPGTKSLPSPYVKLYLMKNKKCLAKSKTSPARRTLDPLYQQQFIFREDYTNCILQLIVWGDYGKKDRKSLMGIVQIRIDDLDISNLVIGWYRMFNAPSMTHSLVSSKALRHMLLSRTADTD